MSSNLFSDMKKRVQDESDATDLAKASYEKLEKGKTLNRRPLAYKQPIPDDLWIRCSNCQAAMLREDFYDNNQVCTSCNYHYRINAWERIWLVADEGSYQEIDRGVHAANPINFEGYEEKISNLQAKTGLNEAIVTGKCTIQGVETYLAAMDARFLMGSMNAALGEKIVRVFEKATEEELPVIIFTVSGGARMHEGIVSLMQMVNTSAAAKVHSEKGLLYISFMTDPTTGGVTASFASLGDIILSEPGAIIGFAGRRVIEGTIAEKLPEDFQRAEFQQEHGFLDNIIPRNQIRDTLGNLLAFHAPEKKSTSRLAQSMQRSRQRHNDNIHEGEEPIVIYNLEQAKDHEFASGSECLQIIRTKGRPNFMTYLPLIFDSVFELKGDRYYGEDPAMWTGLASFKGMPVTVIGERKGRNLAENNLTNFGMPHPEGYRKALRVMKQAEKFNRPIITFIDTSGAYSGVSAEERGQGEAIARSIAEMSHLKVPVISVIIGEGGSGGALGIAVADKLAMLSNSIYSVISPRGFSSLLWRDSEREMEAADIIKITAIDVMELGINDAIIMEGPDGAHENTEFAARGISKFIEESLVELDEEEVTVAELLKKRYHKYRDIGPFYKE